jgi:hypothetical protein
MVRGDTASDPFSHGAFPPGDEPSAVAAIGTTPACCARATAHVAFVAGQPEKRVQKQQEISKCRRR